MIKNKITTDLKLNVYQHLNSIEFLREIITHNAGTYGYKAKIAEAANCQRSHLSLVLKGQAHFTAEQAIGVAEFLGLDWKEKSYFLLLTQFARAGTPELKSFLSAQLEEQLKAQENFSQRINEKTILPEDKTAVVYASWEPLAIIIALSIPKIRTSVALAERLELRSDHVEKILNQLKEIGLVENRGIEWRATEKNIHLPKASRFNSLNHSHWRLRAVQNSFLENEDVHYTSVCTLSAADVRKMKQMMLEFIDKSREIVSPSAEEELFCLTCDWFRV